MFFFKKQKFFLDLTGEKDTDQEGKAAKPSEPKVVIAPPAPAPAAEKKEKGAAKAPAPPAIAASTAPAAAVAPATPAAVVEAAAPAPGPAAVRTTAEEIAAQLAAEAASRPAPTLSTFAPDCLAPGAATPRRRRTAGANLGAFKEIARGMMKS
ncbi:MAG: hypothetical protein VKM17_11285 [Cyanobacteriota bacterium]|nr:hypothetical protein [Cyanobacteriota bacterium]